MLFNSFEFMLNNPFPPKTVNEDLETITKIFQFAFVRILHGSFSGKERGRFFFMFNDIHGANKASKIVADELSHIEFFRQANIQ